MPPEFRFPLSRLGLFRYQAVCAVEMLIDGGVSLAHAITEVARRPLRDLFGQNRRVSQRSLYRWVRAYRAGGIEALESEPRPKIADSAVLPQELVDFIRVEKQKDTIASIPELLRRAQQKGIVADDESISRVSVWRACLRMELPTARRKKAERAGGVLGLTAKVSEAEAEQIRELLGVDGVFLFFDADEVDEFLGQNRGVGYFLPWLTLESLDSSCSVSFHPTVQTALGNAPILTEQISERSTRNLGDGVSQAQTDVDKHLNRADRLVSEQS